MYSRNFNISDNRLPPNYNGTAYTEDGLTTMQIPTLAPAALTSVTDEADINKNDAVKVNINVNNNDNDSENDDTIPVARIPLEPPQKPLSHILKTFNIGNHNITVEDMLLVGLIILLISNQSDENMILILAFILLAGL